MKRRRPISQIILLHVFSFPLHTGSFHPEGLYVAKERKSEKESRRKAEKTHHISFRERERVGPVLLNIRFWLLWCFNLARLWKHLVHSITIRSLALWLLSRHLPLHGSDDQFRAINQSLSFYSRPLFTSSSSY